jgi:hypothetical protein
MVNISNWVHGRIWNQSPEVKLLMLPTNYCDTQDTEIFFGVINFQFCGNRRWDYTEISGRYIIYYILCIYIYKYIQILDDSCWFIDPDASRCPWLSPQRASRRGPG